MRELSSRRLVYRGGGNRCEAPCPSRRTRRRRVRAVRRDRAGPTGCAGLPHHRQPAVRLRRRPGLQRADDQARHPHADQRRPLRHPVGRLPDPARHAADPGGRPADRLRRRDLSHRRVAHLHHGPARFGPRPHAAAGARTRRCSTRASRRSSPSWAPSKAPSSDEAGEQFKLYSTDLAHEVIDRSLVLLDEPDPRLHRRLARRVRDYRVARRPRQRRSRDRQGRAQDRRPRHLPPDGDNLARPAATSRPASARSSFRHAICRSTRWVSTSSGDGSSCASAPASGLDDLSRRGRWREILVSDERATPDRLLRARRP